MWVVPAAVRAEFGDTPAAHAVSAIRFQTDLHPRMYSMSMTNRRSFMLQLAAGSSALAVAATARAQAAAKLPESDPQAVALGYKDDTTKVDAAKFPNHSPSQKCNGCQLYQGKASDATGPCALFAGKHVASAGWCSAWTKKA